MNLSLIIFLKFWLLKIKIIHLFFQKIKILARAGDFFPFNFIFGDHFYYERNRLKATGWKKRIQNDLSACEIIHPD